MKYRVFAPIAALVLFFSACAKKENSKDDTTKIPAQNTTVAQTESLQKIATALDGLWVSDEYLTTIEKTKKPFANANHKATLFGFVLEQKALLKGNAKLEGFNTFEGGYTYPLQYNSNGYFELNKASKTKYPENDYMQVHPLANGNAEITYTKTGKKDVFRKIAPANSNDINVLNYTIGALVFGGTYTNEATGKTITFDDHGNVTGLGKLKHYRVQYAFEDRNFDEVYFSENEMDPKTADYHFVFEGNTVRLYGVGLDENVSEYYIENTPAFTLVKK